MLALFAYFINYYYFCSPNWIFLHYHEGIHYRKQDSLLSGERTYSGATGSRRRCGQHYVRVNDPANLKLPKDSETYPIVNCIQTGKDGTTEPNWDYISKVANEWVLPSPLMLVSVGLWSAFGRQSVVGILREEENKRFADCKNDRMKKNL